MSAILMFRLILTCIVALVVLTVVSIWSPPKLFPALKAAMALVAALVAVLALVVIWGGVHP